MFKRLLKSLLERRSDSEAPKADDLLPPMKLQQFVGGNYKEVGDEFLRHLIQLCELKPHDAVLDIGSGSGRVAVPLTRYLSHEGMYRGFDVSVKGIKWCRENITPRFRNFEFEAADINNGSYNRKGKFKSSEYRFAYSDATFDVAVLASVFTHMLPADMKHYMTEIARVLKPGGRCLSTFFLRNDESVALMSAGAGAFNFKYEGAGYHSAYANKPENAVSYPEDVIRKLFEENGMRVEEPIRYGSWSGRQQFLSFQDIVIATKLGA